MKLPPKKPLPSAKAKGQSASRSIQLNNSSVPIAVSTQSADSNGKRSSICTSPLLASVLDAARSKKLNQAALGDQELEELFHYLSQKNESSSRKSRTSTWDRLSRPSMHASLTSEAPKSPRSTVPVSPKAKRTIGASSPLTRLVNTENDDSPLLAVTKINTVPVNFDRRATEESNIDFLLPDLVVMKHQADPSARPNEFKIGFAIPSPRAPETSGVGFSVKSPNEVQKNIDAENEVRHNALNLIVSAPSVPDPSPRAVEPSGFVVASPHVSDERDSRRQPVTLSSQYPGFAYVDHESVGTTPGETYNFPDVPVLNDATDLDGELECHNNEAVDGTDLNSTNAAPYVLPNLVVTATSVPTGKPDASPRPSDTSRFVISSPRASLANNTESYATSGNDVSSKEATHQTEPDLVSPITAFNLPKVIVQHPSIPHGKVDASPRPADLAGFAVSSPCVAGEVNSALPPDNYSNKDLDFEHFLKDESPIVCYNLPNLFIAKNEIRADPSPRPSGTMAFAVPSPRPSRIENHELPLMFQDSDVMVGPGAVFNTDTLRAQSDSQAESASVEDDDSVANLEFTVGYILDKVYTDVCDRAAALKPVSSVIASRYDMSDELSQVHSVGTGCISNIIMPVQVPPPVPRIQEPLQPQPLLGSKDKYSESKPLNAVNEDEEVTKKEAAFPVRAQSNSRADRLSDMQATIISELGGPLSSSVATTAFMCVAPIGVRPNSAPAAGRRFSVCKPQRASVNDQTEQGPNDYVSQYRYSVIPTLGQVEKVISERLKKRPNTTDGRGRGSRTKSGTNSVTLDTHGQPPITGSAPGPEEIDSKSIGPNGLPAPEGKQWGWGWAKKTETSGMKWSVLLKSVGAVASPLASPRSFGEATVLGSPVGQLGSPPIPSPSNVAVQISHDSSMLPGALGFGPSANAQPVISTQTVLIDGENGEQVQESVLRLDFDNREQREVPVLIPQLEDSPKEKRAKRWKTRQTVGHTKARQSSKSPNSPSRKTVSYGEISGLQNERLTPIQTEVTPVMSRNSNYDYSLNSPKNSKISLDRMNIDEFKIKVRSGLLSVPRLVHEHDDSHQVQETVRKAKSLAMESGQSGTNFGMQISLLFQMQHHYKLLVGSKSCVDSRLDGKVTRLAQKKHVKPVRKSLKAKVRHTVANGDGLKAFELHLERHMADSSASGQVQRAASALAKTTDGTLTQFSQETNWVTEAKILAHESGGVYEPLAAQISNYFHMRHHVAQLSRVLVSGKPIVNSWNSLIKPSVRPSRRIQRLSTNFFTKLMKHESGSALKRLTHSTFDQASTRRTAATSAKRLGPDDAGSNKPSQELHVTGRSSRNSAYMTDNGNANRNISRRGTAEGTYSGTVADFASSLRCSSGCLLSTTGTKPRTSTSSHIATKPSPKTPSPKRKRRVVASRSPKRSRSPSRAQGLVTRRTLPNDRMRALLSQGTKDASWMQERKNARRLQRILDPYQKTGFITGRSNYVGGTNYDLRSSLKQDTPGSKHERTQPTSFRRRKLGATACGEPTLFEQSSYNGKHMHSQQAAYNDIARRPWAEVLADCQSKGAELLEDKTLFPELESASESDGEENLEADSVESESDDAIELPRIFHVPSDGHETNVGVHSTPVAQRSKNVDGGIFLGEQETTTSRRLSFRQRLDESTMMDSRVPDGYRRLSHLGELDVSKLAESPGRSTGLLRLPASASETADQAPTTPRSRRGSFVNYDSDAGQSRSRRGSFVNYDDLGHEAQKINNAHFLSQMMNKIGTK